MTIQDRVRSVLRNPFFVGILLIVIGLFMLLWPQASLRILCIIAGILLIFVGGISLYSYITGRPNTQTGSYLAVSIAILGSGILLLVLSWFFVSIFLILAGIVLLYGCFVMFRNAYQLRNTRNKEFYCSLIPAILILIIAILMIFNPLKTAAFIIQLFGIAGIIEGLYLLFSAKEGW